MMTDQRIEITEKFARQRMKNYDSGHDWWHIVRVRKLALFINSAEALTDPFVVDVTALLHDAADSKFAGKSNEQGYIMISDFMEKNGMGEIKNQVLDVIKKVSYSSNYVASNSDDPLLWIIQDADRLDAIGAIGIARAFNYGGFRNNPIYIPGIESESNDKSTIGHFYSKLLKLKDTINTSTGRKIAEERHEILESFLKQFYSEWDFVAYKR